MGSGWLAGKQVQLREEGMVEAEEDKLEGLSRLHTSWTRRCEGHLVHLGGHQGSSWPRGDKYLGCSCKIQGVQEKEREAVGSAI